MFVLKQQRSLQNNTFLVFDMKQKHSSIKKMKFLRTRKVPSSSLKFKFPFKFKFGNKICRTPPENEGSRWHHCHDNFEWNWYIDRSSILQSRTFVRTERMLASGAVFREWLQYSKLKIKTNSNL